MNSIPLSSISAQRESSVNVQLEAACEEENGVITAESIPESAWDTKYDKNVH